MTRSLPLERVNIGAVGGVPSPNSFVSKFDKIKNEILNGEVKNREFVD